MKDLTIVIARYKENLEWITKFKYNYVIYNKGEDNLYIESTLLPNVGRESETYLRYIIDNYHSLPNLVGFVQGDPYPHCYEFDKRILEYNNEPFFDLSNGITWCLPNGLPHHELPIEEYARLLGIYTSKPTYYFCPGAQFIVKKETILKRSYEFWLHTHYIHTNSVLTPWIFERLWGELFFHNFSLDPADKYSNTCD